MLNRGLRDAHLRRYELRVPPPVFHTGALDPSRNLSSNPVVFAVNHMTDSFADFQQCPLTGAGAATAPAFHSVASRNQPDRHEGRTGQFARGGSAEQFNSYWVATHRFTLPPRVRRRGVLLLNAVVGAGPGRMFLSPNLPDTEFHFTNATS